MLSRAGAVLAALVCAVGVVHLARAPEQPLGVQPFPDSAEYADAARSLARGDGYNTRVHRGLRRPPRYPPGYPLALVPFAAVGTFPGDVQTGAKFYVIFYFVATLVAAWALGGPLAAILAAAFVLASPFSRQAAGLVLSDALVAGLTVLLLPLLAHAGRGRARLAGAATGLALLARLTAAINLLALVVAWPGRSVRSVVLFALPAVVGLLILQATLYGSPLRTGYAYWHVAANTFELGYTTSGATLREGSAIFPDRLDGRLVDWVCACRPGRTQAELPNLTFYPLLLAGGFWVFSPPLVPLFGLAYAWRRRREAVARYALAVTGISLVVFDVYFYQATRFMAGPATVLTVLASVWLAELARVGRGRLRRAQPG